MKRSIFEAWIQDLLDNAEKQGKSRLVDDGLYCCLGRFCVVADLPIVPVDDESLDAEEGFSYNGNVGTELLPDDFAALHGISEEGRVLMPDVVDDLGQPQWTENLAYLNDGTNVDHAWTFSEIAAYLRENEKYFVTEEDDGALQIS